MEAISGQDLNWFFNQWYFDEGHPSLEIEYGYDVANKEAMVAISQCVFIFLPPKQRKETIISAYGYRKGPQIW